MVQKENVRLEAVDGLRGFAILLVIYQHSMATAVGKWLVQQTGFGYPYIVANAWMGVGLFFILSGFVLGVPYFSGAREMRSVDDSRRFWRHRAARLLPLFVVMAFVSYAFAMAVGRQTWQSPVLTLTTASMFTRQEFFPTINGPFWSLSVEIWFSAAFPLILWRSRDSVYRWYFGQPWLCPSRFVCPGRSFNLKAYT